MPRCSQCGRKFRGFGVTYYRYGDNEKMTLCGECALFVEAFLCPSCGYKRIRDGREYYDESRDLMVCGDCIEEKGICKVCGTPGGTKIDKLGCVFCTVVCDGCGKRIPRGSQTDLGGYYLCPKCVKQFTVCDRCGDLIDIEEGCPRCDFERQLIAKLKLD